jgi:flagellar protein FlbT
LGSISIRGLRRNGGARTLSRRSPAKQSQEKVDAAARARELGNKSLTPERQCCASLNQGRGGMPLKLSLRPGERFVVNGAVVQNGDRRASLVLQNKASVLREKDIMQADEAVTPARRIYFPIMLMYLDEAGREKVYEEFATRLAEFMSAVRDQEILAECVGVSKEVMAGEYYRALMRCRKLMAYEAERIGLADVHSGVPARGHAG